MNIDTPSSRKRPVNLTLSVGLVSQARAYTDNLSATMETLLGEFVAQQRQARRTHLQASEACAADWNSVHETLGSFADEHTTL